MQDARLLSRLADDLAGGWLAAGGPSAAQPSDLLELLAGVSDGRLGQGRDHPVAAVLALAAAAVVAGSRSFTAIAGWAADVPAGVLEDLYRRCGAARPGAGPPSRRAICHGSVKGTAREQWPAERTPGVGGLAAIDRDSVLAVV
jgi:hypothetical protein